MKQACAKLVRRSFSPDSDLINQSLPWNYDFKFVVEEISNVNDKAQVSESSNCPVVGLGGLSTWSITQSASCT